MWMVFLITLCDMYIYNRIWYSVLILNQYITHTNFSINKKDLTELFIIPHRKLIFFLMIYFMTKLTGLQWDRHLGCFSWAAMRKIGLITITEINHFSTNAMLMIVSVGLKIKLMPNFSLIISTHATPTLNFFGDRIKQPNVFPRRSY